MDFAHGAIQWLAADAVNTVYTVSGLGFQPKALRFYWQGLGATGSDQTSAATSLRRGVGAAVSTSSRWWTASLDADGTGSMTCARSGGTTAIAHIISDARASSGLLDLNSVTAGGFTVIVDEKIGTAQNVTVFWEAWGGDDISVAVTGSVDEPAVVGTQDYTVTGFESGVRTDQVVLFAGSGAATLETGDSKLWVSFATGQASTTTAASVTGNQDDGSANSDTDGACRLDAIATVVEAGGTTLDAYAIVSQWNTDGFRLDWIARAVTGRRTFYLAMKGGAWAVGVLSIAGNTLNATASVTGLPFTPIGLSLIGRMSPLTAQGTAAAEDRMSLGTGTSPTDRRSMGAHSLHGGGNADIALEIQYDQVLSYPTASSGALLTAYDISAMAADGFTLINDLAGGVASEAIGYLTFGSSAAPGPAIAEAPYILTSRLRTW